MGETIRLEEFTGIIQNKLVAAWQSAKTETPWLPSEFLLAQYITRILVTGRSSPLSLALTADQSWTQVWRSPGGKEWGCLIGILQHMPGPILLVVGPDIVLTPKLTSNLHTVCKSLVTCIVLRSTGQTGWAGDLPTQVFFPVLDGRDASMIAAVQEWTSRAAPRSLDLPTLIPQLSSQGYGLTVSDGIWHWYKPADSGGLVSLTAHQIAKQLQILGGILEKL